MPDHLKFNFSLSRSTGPRISNRGPMRLLVMGDFSGRAAAQRPALAGRPTHRVDIDNLDEVLRRLAPQVALPGGEVSFESLDDFHPDSLFARLARFDALRGMRQRLGDPARFVQAAAEWRQGPAAGPALDNPPGAGVAGGGDLLAQLLGGQPGGAAVAPPVAAAGIEALIHRIVAPHIVPDISQQQARLIGSVDAAITDLLRELLHAPAFQQLEAAWRGVQWLISSLELDESLQLHLFDISRAELLDDVVAAQGRVEQTAVFTALVGRWRNPPGGEGWSVLTGLFAFGPSVEHIGLLAALGVLASQAGAPFLAAGELALAGDDASVLAGWQALRRSEVAPWIGLTTPRVLLRLPYGQGSDPVECLQFEEFGATPVHQQYLWGNAGLACTLLIGRAFMARGWDFEPGDERDIDDLPAYIFVHDGEREMQPCAEQTLSEAMSEALMAAGLMAVMSHRMRNAVTVLRFQSVAEPAQALRGLTGRC